LYLSLGINPVEGAHLVKQVAVVVVEQEGRDIYFVGFLVEIA
jgi:hypothetical protein